MEQRILPPLPEAVIDQTLASDLQERLNSGALFLSLPPSLKTAYGHFRHRDLRRYITLGSPLLMLLVIGIVGLNTLFCWHELQQDGLLLWIIGSAFVTLCVAGGILAVLPQRALPYFSLIVSMPSTLVLAKLATFPSVFANPALGVTESYFCSLAVIVVVLALRLSFRAIVSTLLAASLLTIASDLLIDAYTLNWSNLLYYYVFVAAVSLFIAWQLDEREKTEFLQAVLIDHNLQVNEELRQKLSDQANNDALTGIANRRAFDRALNVEWERLQREQTPLSLLFVDIDHFKLYNDAYGHGAGDDSLVLIATQLRNCLRRPADLAARLGGEEFVVLLPGTEPSGAGDVAQRILTSVDNLRIRHESSPICDWVTVSIGVATMIPSPHSTPQQLLKAADDALYQAKSAGRQRICQPEIPSFQTNPLQL
ncbi:MAG: diguanylate cyclase [Marinobacter sp.]|uniref:GGDEF domain-containing protein n=1 Tax=Marinobacter sp. TaxID=50741 RepID=UPI00299D4951|nr:diguanylate cyclase [Marinobacter sp.]MDX1756157.1 diguanylate cyclase [Marinobacter sp.]